MQAHGWNNVSFRSYYTVSLSLMVDQNVLSSFVSMVSPVAPQLTLKNPPQAIVALTHVDGRVSRRL